MFHHCSFIGGLLHSAPPPPPPPHLHWNNFVEHQYLHTPPHPLPLTPTPPDSLVVPSLGVCHDVLCTHIKSQVNHWRSLKGSIRIGGEARRTRKRLRNSEKLKADRKEPRPGAAFPVNIVHPTRKKKKKKKRAVWKWFDWTWLIHHLQPEYTGEAYWMQKTFDESLLFWFFLCFVCLFVFVCVCFLFVCLFCFCLDAVPQQNIVSTSGKSLFVYWKVGFWWRSKWHLFLNFDSVKLCIFFSCG